MENLETILIPAIILIIICIAVFLLFREVILWYFKIKTIIIEQKRTNVLLEKIFIQLGGNDDSIKQKGILSLPFEIGIQLSPTEMKEASTRVKYMKEGQVCIIYTDDRKIDTITEEQYTKLDKTYVLRIK